MTAACGGADTTPPGDARTGGDPVSGDAASGDPASGDSTPGDNPPPAGPLLRVHYDTGMGSSISVRGDGAGMSWTEGLSCTWSAGNVWLCSLPEQVGPVELKPLVDDTTWAKGTNYVIGADATLDIYPFFFADAGRVEIVTGISSTHLSNTRDVAVYLPPSYDENPLKHYPVLIMHDGQNLFDAATSSFGVEWQVDEAMNALATTAGILEAIIVGPYNNADRIYEYTPTVDTDYGGGGAEPYLDFLTAELQPWIESTYRADDEPPGIAGSSLGGLVSLYGCWTRPTAFDRCGVMSPSLWWDNQNLVGVIENDSGAKPDVTIYLDSGDSGASQDGMALTAGMRDTLIGKGFVLGVDLEYVLGVGHSHDESAWAARTPGALEFLLTDPDRVQP